MAEIIFSAHAVSRIKERHISMQLAVDAVRNPDKIERSSRAYNRIMVKKIYFNKTLKKEHLLMIICQVHPGKIEVITIIDTSKISKYF